MKWLKQLRCNHERWEYLSSYYNDSIHSIGWYKPEQRCIECGKTKFDDWIFENSILKKDRATLNNEERRISLKLEIGSSILRAQKRHEVFWMDRGLDGNDIALLDELEANEPPTEHIYESRYTRVKRNRMNVDEVKSDTLKYKAKRMDV